MSMDMLDADTMRGVPTDAEESSGMVDDLMANIRGVRDALTVGRVFGDPYELGDTIVIPVARIAGGAGGGAGESKEPDAPGSGFGSGFGMDARAVGAYVVHDGAVTWKPAVDATRLARGGQVLAAIALVCATLVLLSRSR